MVIPVLAAGKLLVKAGIGRHIDLAAQNRLDSGFSCRAVKINDTVHNAVVGDCRTVHAKLFHTLDIFFYFVGTV